MHCPKGHGSMTRGEGFWVCLQCGLTIAAADFPKSSAAKILDFPDVEHLPYPAAVAAARLRAAFKSGESAWDRVSLFKDALEATVKSFCVYGLGAYLGYPGRMPERDEMLLERLVRPSTGDWVKLLDFLCRLLRDEAQPCRGLADLFLSRQVEKSHPKHTLQFLQEFVSFRNDLHHGARRPDAEYQNELDARLQAFVRLSIKSIT